MESPDSQEIDSNLQIQDPAAAKFRDNSPARGARRTHPVRPGYWGRSGDYVSPARGAAPVLDRLMATPDAAAADIVVLLHQAIDVDQARVA